MCWLCAHGQSALGTTPLSVGPTKACGYAEILSSRVGVLLTTSLSLLLSIGVQCTHVYQLEPLNGMQILNSIIV